MSSELVEDPRSIEGAWTDAPDEVGATIGYDGVTKIEAYYEPGEMAAVAWLRVWKGGFLASRLNAHALAEIRYSTPKQENKP